jgi:hypothetical protein
MEGTVEVMRVVRVPPLGKLVVAVGEERYDKLSDIRDAAARQRLIAAIGELVVFADGYDALVAAGVAPPAAADESEILSMEERKERFLSSMKRQTDSLRMPDTADLNANDSATGTGTTSEPARDPSLARIVSQLNTILERRIRDNPELESRTIQLLTTDDGDLRIEVDGIYYKRPSEIEDKAAREVVGAALKEFNSG